MVADIHGDVVGSSVPLRLAGHVIVKGAPVDAEILEAHIADLALLAVAVDDRQGRGFFDERSGRGLQIPSSVGRRSGLQIPSSVIPSCVGQSQAGSVADVAEEYVVYATARCGAVLLVVAHLHLQDAALKDTLDADVVEAHVAHEVVIATINGQTALVVDLLFSLTENVDVLVDKVLDGVAHFGVSVQPDENGMSHGGPEGGVAHADVTGVARKTLASGVGRGAVVAVAAEDAVVEHIAGSKDVEAVAPGRMGDATHVADGDTVGSAHGTGAKREALDEHALRAVDVAALVAVVGTGDAPAQDADVVGVVDGEGACEVGARGEVDDEVATYRGGRRQEEGGGRKEISDAVDGGLVVESWRETDEAAPLRLSLALGFFARDGWLGGESFCLSLFHYHLLILHRL